MTSETLKYIANKFNLNDGVKRRNPIEIPDYGRDNLAELFSELDFKTIVDRKSVV